MAIKAPVAAAKVKNRVAQAELAVDNYPCRVAQVIDLGVQTLDVWDATLNKFVPDVKKAPANKLMITYEFTTEFMKDEEGNDVEDRPRWMSEDFPLYPLKSDLATSTKRMKAFDPDFSLYAGDWEKVLGLPCAVSVAHKGSGKAKIGNVAKPMRGMMVAELKNEPKLFSLDAPDMDVFRSLPEWLQERIKGNLNFEGSKLQAALAGESVGKPKEEEKVPEKSVQEAQRVPVEPDVTEGEDDDQPW